MRPIVLLRPLALNPRVVETSSGTETVIDHTIPVGNDGIELQNETWGNLW